jgi:hypothetical protein
VIILFTTYYNEINESRKSELLNCIQFNLKNKLIDKILILIEEKDNLPFDDPKIQQITVSKRPTFQDFFRIINENSFK